MSAASEELKFGYQLPSISRDKAMPSIHLQQIQQSINAKISSFESAGGVVAASKASADTSSEKEAPKEEEKTESKKAKPSVEMEEDEELLKLDDEEETAAPPVNVGKKLSVIGEDGKVVPLIPRNNDPQNERLERVDDPIDIPAWVAPEGKDDYVRKTRAERELKIKNQLEAQFREKEMTRTAAAIQGQFDRAMLDFKGKLKVDDIEVDQINMGIKDSVQNGSLQALHGMQALMGTVAKASGVQKENHSKMIKFHEQSVKLAEKNKALQFLVKDREERLKQLEEKLDQIQNKANLPVFAKSNERVQPKETVQQVDKPNGALGKSEAKRGRVEEENTKEGDLSRIIYQSIAPAYKYWNEQEVNEFATNFTKNYLAANNNRF